MSNTEVEHAFDSAVWRCHRILLWHLGTEKGHSHCRFCDEVEWAANVFQLWKNPQIGEDDLVAARNILTAAEASFGSVIEEPK